jgi:hypothetical protein
MKPLTTSCIMDRASCIKLCGSGEQIMMPPERMNEIEHKSVLLREAVDLLAPRAGGVYADGTIGGGGHAEEILKRSAPDGILIGMDQDAEALERCRERL